MCAALAIMPRVYEVVRQHDRRADPAEAETIGDDPLHALLVADDAVHLCDPEPGHTGLATRRHTSTSGSGPVGGSVSSTTSASPPLRLSMRSLFLRRQLLERLEGGSHEVVRVGRPQRLRQDVGDPGRLGDGADGSAGDDAGTRGGRAEQHPAGPEVADHLVRDRRPAAVDADHHAARRLGGLPDRLGHLTRLSGAEADLAVPVTDHDERRKREVLTALHHLGDAVDAHHVIDELAFPLAHRFTPRTSGPLRGPRPPAP